MGEFDFSDYASGLATIIAVLALCVSLYELAENKPKLRISGDPVFLASPLATKALLVTITNYGRQPTTITGVLFIPKRNARVGPRTGKLVLSPLWEISSATLPTVLEVGRTLTLAFDLDATIPHEGQKLRLRQMIVESTFDIAVNSAWHAKAQMGSVRPGQLASWSE